jgi:hypothetical protein
MMSLGVDVSEISSPEGSGNRRCFQPVLLRTCRFYPETAPIDGRSTRLVRYITCVGGGVASGSSVAVAVASSAADPKNPIMLDMVSLIFFLEFFRN